MNLKSILLQVKIGLHLRPNECSQFKRLVLKFAELFIMKHS